MRVLVHLVPVPLLGHWLLGHLLLHLVGHLLLRLLGQTRSASLQR